MEIGAFLGRDPGAVSKYQQYREGIQDEVKKIVGVLKKTANFKIQA
jgi:hypothetical protein